MEIKNCGFITIFFWYELILITYDYLSKNTDEALENLEPDVATLIEQGEQLVRNTKEKDASLAQELDQKLVSLKTRWSTLKRDAEQRQKALTVVVPLWCQFKKQADEMERWIGEVEEQVKEGGLEDEEKMKVRNCMKPNIVKEIKMIVLG